ncbi:response regulator transcription factor [Capnocytophaga canis]|uniref:Phosphate regulon transcriptional regulatory protein PhoB n=1 Tax=Capnocytophaga canis TaxID=1848903 RepID=A0A0B7IJU3_9FLAO|nr:response regulator transcription factor [Capnocytophaga canis]RIY36332.1 DNA-binding response regulator [Capnocytophaga canis]CEN43646.1 Alkaline phosphatase synthesis transcriptional regulatory protein PhoP [Capnocytophaga canis]CEN50218.1 Alkaline phosphatase synthesis transcriptional regulatory protein PhoP [Capnocytophaga canis]
MKNMKILLVDDEPDILEIVGYNLEKEGFQLFSAKNGIEAIKIAEREQPHLILMDVMMPDMDGIEACERIRRNTNLSRTVIAFLTARGEDYSQLAGFEAGADDYITKPIKPKVLVSKVKALLRRFSVEEEKVTSLTIDNLVIDRDEYKVIRNNEEIILPRKEFELLWLLASQANKVFKRDDILDKVWGSEVVVGDRTIDVHIRKLREKIGENYFKTIKGVGYKLVVKE